MTQSLLGSALVRLEALGFIPVQRRGDARCFEGTLLCKVGPIRVRLEVSDWEFLEYPVIRLLEHPPSLPGVVPHVGATRGFCYFRERSIVLDRYRPDNALWQCIEQAREELDRLSSSPTYRDGEFQNEFGATWTISQFPLPARALIGDIAADSDRAYCYLIGSKASPSLLIATDLEEMRVLCRSHGCTLLHERHAECRIVRSNQYPSLPQKLPSTVREMFDWIRGWDLEAYKTMQKQLSDRSYLEFGATVFVVQTPAGEFGFQFPLDWSLRKGFARKPHLYRQYLHRKGGDKSVVRLYIEPVGQNHVHSRNLRFPNLKDRSITVLGCGAIGGYVAQALVKLGAGSGRNGRLKLVDPDTLSADNLGRHVLGYESLFLPKVTALKEELLRQFPRAKIEAAPRKTIPYEDLRDELIVNATGEEAVSEMLNFYHQQLVPEKRPPLLHTWIVGNGEATQALFVDQHKFACFRCLRLNDEARSERFPLLIDPVETRVIGCRAYTPYAVSSPMAAAALVTDMVIGWLDGTPSPRFRTRPLEGANVRRVKSQDVPPLADCPACRR